jgi:hypothetical protein
VNNYLHYDDFPLRPLLAPHNPYVAARATPATMGFLRVDQSSPSFASGFAIGLVAIDDHIQA